MKKETTKKYIVYKKIRETADVVTLQLIPSGKGIVKYRAGQFITVYFPELGTPSGKAYSLSSAPSDDMVSLSVKDIGTFSHQLTMLEAGDAITGSLPYGFFYSESTNTDLVFIAAGIGIAPFRSMIRDIYEKNPEKDPQRNVSLYYSIRTQADIVFKKELDEIAAMHQNFHVIYFVTREKNEGKNIPKGMENKRISAEYILSHTSDKENVEFFICGSISFIRDIWRDLKEHDVPEETIYTEAFFSH